jgi:restriction system protein
MARRRYWHRRKKEPTLAAALAAALAPLLLLLSIGIVAYVYVHRAQVITWGPTIVGVGVVAAALYYFYKRRKRALALNWDGDKILFMLKGMSPTQFEQEMAEMFRGLGYDAQVVGGANDGGIDVVAHKDGRKYYIQCKKFMTREVTPHDVRDFLGAITNVNNPAEKGYFITTNKFTLMAERAAEGNPRIELIDGIRLVEYYKMAHQQPTAPAAQPYAPQARTCPRCGGELVLRTARHGMRAGHQFWGCANFAKTQCEYIENIP